MTGRENGNGDHAAVVAIAQLVSHLLDEQHAKLYHGSNGRPPSRLVQEEEGDGHR